MNARQQIVLAAFALGATLLPGPGDVRADDVDRMQGGWKATYGEVGGNVGTGKQLKGYRVTIDGNRFTFAEGDKTEVVHFTVSEGARPWRHIDFWQSADKKRKLYHGIYHFDGNSLKLCWGAAGRARPTDFTTKESNDRRFFIIRR
jgi:uncharacterized protein (TIGR03067 family)